jgi:agmatine deiminase
MPAEFSAHERTGMCWPTRSAIYAGRFDEAKRAHATVARTISGYEPVTMIANEADADEAADMCGSGVDVVTAPIDDAWFRDTGPIYVTAGNERIGTYWRFNSWGGKFVPHDNDARLAATWLKMRGEKCVDVDMVLEGGSINVDGEGLLVTTEQCLLHPNRNPKMGRGEIEASLRERLGCTEVVWLPFGLSLDDDTDGHVDNVAAFIAPGIVMMQGCDDPREEDFSRCAANIAAARAAGLTVYEIPILPFVDVDGTRVCVPYLNFYFVNGAVVVPTSGHPADTDMLALIGDTIPDRDVIGLDVGTILAIGGGGIHCITQQVPAVSSR